MRIGLWVVGGLSGMLLILYLPVLIWSPPWSHFGCYVMENSPENFTANIFSNDQMVTIGTGSNSEPPLKVSDKLDFYDGKTLHQSQWRGSNSGRTYTIHKTGRLYYWYDPPEGDWLGSKTINPFTIWYCLYLNAISEEIEHPYPIGAP